MTTMPPVLAHVDDVLHGFPVRWALCGGWAVDAWLGRTTRAHQDVDLSIAIEDQAALLEHFRDGWLLNGHDALDEDGTAPWTGRVLGYPSHVHCYAPDGALHLDVQLNRVADGTWVFHGAEGVRRPAERCVATTDWRLPALTPPVILFYKGEGEIRPHDEADFHALWPTLARGDQSWLRRSLLDLRPEHQWRSSLVAAGSDGGGAGW